ncbi:MAG: sigma-70 family RNA polymerase sigma factor [Phycisphaeraceae bacterium]|nr:sigma-70 family RNA polymerase sigma factor [Phycisphaerales bacterium]MCB9859816.1 sigma-70 family RNA polymerase sigma factor [Phycisphaeraceae bacterium]
MADSVHTLVDHLFRRESARLSASLVRALGVRYFDLAEECVHEALLAALETWSFNGIPDEPAAWLARVAKNRALDAIRHKRVQVDHATRVQYELQQRLDAQAPVSEHEFDDQLLMIFACCHPRLTEDTRIALTLKTCCGFSVNEIAGALLSKPATIAQRIVRAKRTLLDEQIELAIPSESERAVRLDSVLRTLYLMFNEGYASHEGDAHIRRDLLEDAMRLLAMVTSSRSHSSPSAHALLALMFFQLARVSARLDDAGSILLLEEQDRSKWDRDMINAGFTELQLAREGATIPTAYHFEAAIAATHVSAPTFADTDWRAICDLYDALMELRDTPIVRLNRAVAIAHAFGPEEGLRAHANVSKDNRIAQYHLFHAVRGELYRRLGRHEDAIASFDEAIARTRSTAERQLLQRKRSRCNPT